MEPVIRRLPRSETMQYVKKTFPGFDRRERKKIAVLVNQQSLLEQKELAGHKHPADLALNAALRWALEELAALEYDDSPQD